MYLSYILNISLLKGSTKNNILRVARYGILWGGRYPVSGIPHPPGTTFNYSDIGSQKSKPKHKIDTNKAAMNTETATNNAKHWDFY